MIGGWQAAPVESERPVRHEAAPMMWTDPRSLGALPYEFAIHEALLRHRFTDRFTVVVSATSLAAPHHGGHVVAAVDTYGKAGVLEYATFRGAEPPTGLAAVLGGREVARGTLPAAARALLARIDARRERLRQEHGTFPDSGEIIRALREHGEE